MRRLAILSAVLLTIGVAWWRISAQTERPLPSLMPAGALVYLEATDFSKLLHDWNASKLKTDWLASANFEVFSHSNLSIKLSDVYDQYTAAAGFAPDLASISGMAGGESALALYDIHNLQFLYITRLAQSRLLETQLWAVKSKFEERQSAGVTFYVHQESERTVAFAFTEGYLLVATREDLLAQALALAAGGKDPSVAGETWFESATHAASSHGELRMVLDLDALVKTSYSKSYWIHHNATELKQYSAGIEDVARDPQKIVENRILLRSADSSVKPAPDDVRASLAQLAALRPDNAGLYKAWAGPSSDFAASAIVGKLLDPRASVSMDTRYAPPASSTGEAAGTEADLETRIDEPPLSADSSGALVTGPLQSLLEQAQPQALLEVQSTTSLSNGFITTPCVIAIAAASDWNGAAVRESLTKAVETLWTTSRLGAQWIPATAGTHAIQRLNGLAPLLMISRGHILFLSNDAGLLAAVLDRSTTPTPAKSSQLTYSAAFRHRSERANYNRLMSTLDLSQSVATSNGNQPQFFSQNLASLSGLLSFVNEVSVTASDRGNTVVEQVVYSIGR